MCQRRPKLESSIEEILELCWTAAEDGFSPLDRDNLPKQLLCFLPNPIDPETGLQYFGARYYDPRTSLWQSADPILDKYLPNASTKPEEVVKLQPVTVQQPLAQFNLPGMGGVFNPTNLAMYTYVHQNPAKHVDPDGRNPLLVLLGVALIANEVATSDVPMIGGGLAKAGATAAERLAANGVAGKTGEAITRAELGAEKIAGEQITFITSTGKKTVADFVTKIEGLLGIVETKTGNASLRAGQKQLKQDIENGIAVTPVGKNAEKAGLKPGQPIKLDSHTTDRIKVKAPE